MSTLAHPVRVPGLRNSGARAAARFVVWELALWAGLYGAYLTVRGFTIGSRVDALRNAEALVAVERSAGVLVEAEVQAATRSAEGVLSAYYTLGFGPFLVAVLVWLAWRDAAAYRRLRTLLLVSIALATVVFALHPVAPPRMIESLGIADSVGLSRGHDHGSFLGIRFNPYAAMPSMHVGWSLLAGLCAARACRRSVPRAVLLAHPALMAVTVVATGNHYVLDVLAGVAVAGAAALAVRVAPAALRRVTPRGHARPPLRVATPFPERRSS